MLRRISFLHIVLFAPESVYDFYTLMASDSHALLHMEILFTT